MASWVIWPPHNLHIQMERISTSLYNHVLWLFIFNLVPVDLNISALNADRIWGVLKNLNFVVKAKNINVNKNTNS